MLAVLGAISAIDAGVALVNRGVTLFVGPVPLPGLHLRDGVPESLRTLVAVPTLLTTPEAIEEQIERLEIHHLACPEGDLHFALLSDWTDAQTEHVEGDEALLDAAAKGVQLALDGVDEVEGRKAYRLSAKLPSGTTQRVWIDAETFLELKYDRPARDAAGRPSTVAVYLRNYQTYEGLKIPFTIETGTPGGGPIADRLAIDRIAINANLPDGTFARPGQRTSRRGITVDTRPKEATPGAPAAASR
jgi:hypothetical protein